MKLQITKALACVLVVGLFSLARAQDGDLIQDSEVAELQAALRFLGHRIETVDGTYGEETKRAVEAFEFSVGMGNEGELDEGELALLEAQVAALSFEKFGYRLRGFWGAEGCGQNPGSETGFWLDDLALLVGEERLPLLELHPEDPWLVTIDQQPLSLTSSYFTPANSAAGSEGTGLVFFPQPDRLIAIFEGQGQVLQHCETDLSGWSAELALKSPFSYLD